MAIIINGRDLTVEDVIKVISKNAAEVTTLGDPRLSKKIILAGVFKRTYVDKQNGVPFLGGRDMPVYESIKNADNRIVISAANRDSVTFGWDKVIAELTALAVGGKKKIALDGWYGIDYAKVANALDFPFAKSQASSVPTL